MTRHKLIEIDWPEFHVGQRPAPPDAGELQERLDKVRQRMDMVGLTHLVVYGDREHFGNLRYLTNFDPRYEEALLIINQDSVPLLIVGNECLGYLDVSPLHKAGGLRHELYQPFSLLSQSRGNSRHLRDILAGEGISVSSKIGCAGWKYFGETEQPRSETALEIPSFIVDELRALSAFDAVVNATSIFMHPATGLRARASATDIAYFEFTNALSSEAMRRMLFGLEEGMSDYDVIALAGYNGEPFNCHMTFATGANASLGLGGPSGQIIQLGNPLSTNFAYWGSNICRAGWIARSDSDLPGQARDYVSAFAGPYFEAVAEWLAQLRIGVQGQQLAELIDTRLPFEAFGISLNPGHLIHFDEWVSSPIYPGSKDEIASGMVFQVDIIPSSPSFGSSRMEEGVVLADSVLRAEIKERYPNCYDRCQQRRQFMESQLGFELAEEILPLSNIPGLVPPFFLNPNLVFALSA